jgi:hypothetical protein
LVSQEVKEMNSIDAALRWIEVRKTLSGDMMTLSRMIDDIELASGGHDGPDRGNWTKNYTLRTKVIEVVVDRRGVESLAVIINKKPAQVTSIRQELKEVVQEYVLADNELIQMLDFVANVVMEGVKVEAKHKSENAKILRDILARVGRVESKQFTQSDELTKAVSECKEELSEGVASLGKPMSIGPGLAVITTVLGCLIAIGISTSWLL